MTRRFARRPMRAGVTILELMVALTAGLILVSSVYFVSAGASRHFQEQQRISQTQTSVRMAMEVLRRDIGNAGLLSTPNSRKERTCIAPQRHVQAVQFTNDASNAAIPNGAANSARADLLMLTGAYGAQEEFLTFNVNGAGDTIYLQSDWQSYRRLFDGLAGATLETAWDEVFMTNRGLRIQTNDGNVFFVTIVSAASANASVTFTPAFNLGAGCPAGLLGGARVSVMSRIRYTIETATTIGPTATNLEPTNSTVTGPQSYLVRREIANNAAGTTIGPIPRIILEWAVDFDLDFWMDTQTTTNAAATLTFVQGSAIGDLLADVNTNAAATPHQVRSIVASISARTAEQDPLYDVTPATARPLTVFKAIAANPGNARVRTLRTEIFLPNVASRMLR